MKSSSDIIGVLEGGNNPSKIRIRNSFSTERDFKYKFVNFLVNDLSELFKDAINTVHHWA